MNDARKLFLVIKSRGFYQAHNLILTPKKCQMFFYAHNLIKSGKKVSCAKYSNTHAKRLLKKKHLRTKSFVSTIFRRTHNYSKTTLQEYASYFYPFSIVVRKMILQNRNISKLNASWSDCRVSRSYEDNLFVVDKTSFSIYSVNFFSSVHSGKSLCEKNSSQYLWCVFSKIKKWRYSCFLFAHA